MLLFLSLKDNGLSALEHLGLLITIKVMILNLVRILESVLQDKPERNTI